MTVGATAITIFHPPSEPERFGRWVAGYLSSARHSPGYVIGRESVQGSRQLDWAVAVSFDKADLLDAWLEALNARPYSAKVRCTDAGGVPPI